VIPQENQMRGTLLDEATLTIMLKGIKKGVVSFSRFYSEGNKCPDSCQ
jgi:hypothetical protein